ncbi:lipopolysaccharide biosynthesis protein [Spirosoma knui]
MRAQLMEHIQRVHPRTRKVQINTIISVFSKGMGMLVSLLIVPITIDYLSKDVYGTWLTISSIVSMLAFMDIGIGNGLRNKLAEAMSRQDTNLARAYVSTAYLIFGLIQLGVIILFLLIFRYVPWQLVFNTTIDSNQLQSVVLMTVLAVSMKLVLDVLSYVLLAIQDSSLVGIITLLSNLFVLLGTYCLTQFTNGNLVYLAAVTVFSPVLVLLICGTLLYKSRLREIRPTLNFADFKYAKGLLSLGYKFFVIQMAVIVLFYTDNFVIAQLFGPSEVTTYNVAFRYFNAVNTMFAISITPYWSAFTEASVKGDVEWMKQSHRHMQKLWLILVGVVIAMVLSSDYVYKVWVDQRVIVPMSLNICMGLFIVVSCWNNIIAMIINGLGKIQLQLYYALFSAFVNIPLAIYFGKTLNMGSAGVILATAVSLLACSIFGKVQIDKLIAGTAKGIWNR